jgi:hypothetical protein
MDTKEQRLAVGRELEMALLHSLRQHNFEVERPERTPAEDLKHGDIRAKDKTNGLVRIDCKRGASVSLRSVDGFEGEYYLFAVAGSLDPNDWWFVPAKTVKAYAEKARTEPVRLPSGEDGVHVAIHSLRRKKWFFDFVKDGLTF